MLHMPRTTKIHQGKQPNRVHFIAEWAEHRQKRPSDLVRDLNVDKSTVSRWFAGALPREQHLEQLAAYFETDIPGLFRAPHDDWMSRFLQGRSEDEIERARRALELMFPATGTDN
tara:strand:+ start:442 stop:786 length:345 start_codon:yes stop_codon:yes gene_type:complete